MIPSELETLRVSAYRVQGVSPKGPCTHIVYTLALKYSPYRYIGPKVYAIWVHGPLGKVMIRPEIGNSWPGWVQGHAEPEPKSLNTGALIIRIGSWGPLYYNYNKERPK